MLVACMRGRCARRVVELGERGRVDPGSDRGICIVMHLIRLCHVVAAASFWRKAGVRPKHWHGTALLSWRATGVREDNSHRDANDSAPNGVRERASLPAETLSGESWSRSRYVVASSSRVAQVGGGMVG